MKIEILLIPLQANSFISHIGNSEMTTRDTYAPAIIDEL
jgi:hypothetical protein